MEKENLYDLKRKKIFNGEVCTIYKLDDGRILKLVAFDVIESCMMMGTTYEAKIMSNLANDIPEIVKPITAVYIDDVCCGYTMEEVHGESLNEYDINYTLKQKSNLMDYYRRYEMIEDVVKRANKKGIVVPDLCTCDNIIFTNDGIKMIDYDGLQFGANDYTIMMSTSLGNPDNYLNYKKYCKEPFCFNSELDKTSLTILMFLWIFNINLLKVGQINPTSKKQITLRGIFEMLGIYDEEFMNKVEANLSHTVNGAYLAGDLFRIAQNYNMVAGNIKTGETVKVLIHK